VAAQQILGLRAEWLFGCFGIDSYHSIAYGPSLIGRFNLIQSGISRRALMKRILQFHVLLMTALALGFPVRADAGGDSRKGEQGYSDENRTLSPADKPEIKADNTAINARDRDQNSLTPMEQGTLMPDIDTTAGIRKDIMARKGMSVNAQNVKIITQYGQVTLRGPVKTQEEKKFIGKSARSRINPENVDNQLEVVGDSGRD